MICAISDELAAAIKKFRSRKDAVVAALIVKIVKDRQALVVDEELEDCSIDDIRSTLPDQQPRFVLISYPLQHTDSRLSFPQCLVYLSPQGCNPEQQMLYAGSKNYLVKEAGVNKDFEIRDLDELTEELIEDKLRGR